MKLDRQFSRRLKEIGIQREKLTDIELRFLGRVVAGELLLVVQKMRCKCEQCHQPKMVVTLVRPPVKSLKELFHGKS